MKEPVSEDTTRALAEGAGGKSLHELFAATLEGARRLSLLIYHRDGVAVVRLAEGRPVTVGRGREADLCLPDGSLSRRHASFELCREEVLLRDLGSTNGSRVNGQPVERARLSVVDRVTLGMVPVILTSLDPDGVNLHGLDSHDRFLVALEEEVARCRHFKRAGALLLLGEPGGEGVRLHRWAPDARRLLRPFDRAGLYGPGKVEVLLAEAGAEQATELGQRVLAAGEAAGVPLRGGLAVHPVDGTGAEVLLEAALEAMGRATRADPLRRARRRTTRALSEAGSEPGPGDPPVLRSPAMQALFETASRVAERSIPVLIVGETGSGKEVLARAIHQRSGARAAGPLSCVNCGALAEELLESTLFGHERGAFTGAHKRRRGIFEAAAGGTVLLDEIGELSPGAQAALLRVLETRQVRRVGATDEVPVDVRVLAATHRDLEAMVRQGDFREDLLYRLNAVTLEVPPLRRRPEEIVPLACHFIAEAVEAGEGEVTALDAAAAQLLRAHRWPGNVRELRNVVARGVVLARGETLTAEDLPRRVREAGGLSPAAGPDTPPPDLASHGLKELVAVYEAGVIRGALERTGDRRAAADLLGLPLRTLAHKMTQYGVRMKDLG